MDVLPALEQHLALMPGGADRAALRLAITEIKRLLSDSGERTRVTHDSVKRNHDEAMRVYEEYVRLIAMPQ